MLKLPNLELLDYIAKRHFFANDENRKLYAEKNKGSLHQSEEFFKVEMFPQMWGSTSLDFDIDENGNATFGGQMLTESYTTVFFEPRTEIYLVFFGDKPCYQVQDANDAFLNDLKNHNLQPLSKAKELY